LSEEGNKAVMGFWQITLLVLSALCVLALGCFAAALAGAWRFVTQRSIEPTREWLDEFDFTRYATLPKLFSPQDFDFLRSQPGYSPELLSRLKADRLNIAESYLRQLEADVRRLLTIANQASGKAGNEAGDFSGFLLRQECQFTCSMIRLRFQLMLMKLGLAQQIQFEHLLENIHPLVEHSLSLSGAI
jgi:hypothetical protein